MNHIRSLAHAFLSLCLLPFCMAADPDVPRDKIDKVKAALPRTVRVKPAKPRRVLIFTLCRGFPHGSIPCAAVALKMLGETTGAYTAEISDDIAMFEPATLAGFDAVIMDNTTGDLFADPKFKELSEADQAKAAERENRLKKSFVDFVRKGGGLVGVHAATDCLYKWADYGDMLGGYFSGHPWHEEVTVKLDDPGHPLCAAFRGQTFKVTDEIYQFRDPYSRDKLRVLLSLDTSKTNMDKGDKIKRQDDDFAVAWVQNYGKGRVFYCSLGHRDEIFWNPAVMQHYLDGIQFALGDLEADATPSAQLSEEYLSGSRRDAFAAGVEAVFADITTFELGKDSATAQQIAEMVVQAQRTGAADQAAVLVDKLAGLLDSDVTADCKAFACRQLRIIGTAKAVPALSRLLRDASFAEFARYALEDIPGDEAGSALRAALADTTALTRVGVVNSLGVRRDVKAVPLLATLMGDADTATAEAATLALGRIGNDACAQALVAARGSSAVRLRIDQALLECAALLEATDPADRRAGSVYELLMDATDALPHVRAAGFYNVMRRRGAPALADVLAVLKQERSPMTEAAARLIAELPGNSIAADAAKALPGVHVTNQPLVIDALATRGDRAAAKAVLAMVASEDVDVKLAALRGLERIGDVDAITVLAKIAAESPDRSAEQNLARGALDYAAAPGMDAAIAKLVESAPKPLRVELVRCLGARQASAAMAVVLQAARDDDADVRKAAHRSLSAIAKPEHLTELVGLVLQIEKESERVGLANLLVSVSKQIADEDRRADAVLAKLKEQLPPSARALLFNVLGRIASDASLPALYAGLEDKDGDVRKSALRALADWPTSTPIDRLRAVSLSSPDLVSRVLAMRGYARQLALPSARPFAKTLELYQEAMQLAQGEQEKKSLLGGLGNLYHPAALELALKFTDDEALRAEAFQAAASIHRGLQGAGLTLSASHGGAAVRDAIDGVRDTRWTTGAPMVPDMWFAVDMGYETSIEKVTLDAGDTGADYPRGYEVYVSKDGEDWGKPVVTGEGKQKVFTIDVPPTTGRHVKIVQTGSSGGMFWSICEISINGCPQHVDTAKALLDTSTWKLSACHTSDAEAPEHVIDGDMDKRWGTGAAQKPGDWFMVDLGEEKEVLRLVLDSAKSGNDYPRGYEIYVSSDGEKWTGPIAKGEGEGKLTTIDVLPWRGRFVKIVQTGEHDRNWWSMYDLKIHGR